VKIGDLVIYNTEGLSHGVPNNLGVITKITKVIPGTAQFHRVNWLNGQISVLEERYLKKVNDDKD
tara:strand:+ start:385 stop:579 length:195 start_codon:yes stop_codon:yes gene_type:complete